MPRETLRSNATRLLASSALAVGRPAAAPGCLPLQDRCGVDVNIVMLCCWIGASGRGRLEAGDIETMLAVARRRSDEAVVPLSRLRRRLKPQPAAAPHATVEAMRRRIAAAEHAEQLMFAAAVVRTPDRDRPAARRLADAVASLERYLTAIGVAADAADRADLVALLARAFPDLDRGEVEKMVTVPILRRY